MAESKETVLGIVEQIFQAREPASVTNRMMARVLEYVVEYMLTGENLEDIRTLRTRMNGAEQRIATAEGDIDALESGKANSADVETALLQKADAADVAAALLQKADASDVNAALDQKANKSEVTVVSDALDALAARFVVLSQAEYDALVASGHVDASTFYYIKEEDE